MKIIKTSQAPDISQGVSKQSFKNKIYKAIAPYIKGIYSDQSWEAIRKVWDVFDSMNLNWAMTNATYDNSVPPQNKAWRFEIIFVNKRGKEDSLTGIVTAHGAGTVEDPLLRYDITVVMG